MRAFSVVLHIGQGLLWLLGGLLMLAFVGLIWLTTTQTGARFAVAQAEARVPGLSIGAVHGAIGGVLTLDDLAYRPPTGAAVTIAHARWQLNGQALWRGQLMLDALDLDEVGLRLPAASTATAEPSAPLDFSSLPLAVPLPITLTALHLRAFRIEEASGRVVAELPQLALRAAADAHALRLSLLPGSELTVPAAALSLSASGKITLATAAPHAVSGQLAWRIARPEGWLPGEITLEGNLRTLRARVEAAALGNWLNGQLPPVSAVVEVALPLSRAPERVEIPRFSVDALGGCLTGSAVWDGGSALSAQGSLRLHGIDPGILIPALAGQVSATVSGRWQAATGGAIAVSALNGTVAGLSLNALALKGSWDAQAARAAVTGGQLAGGDLTVSAHYGFADNHPVTARWDWSGWNLSPLLRAQGEDAVARGQWHFSAKGELGADPVSTADIRVDAALRDGVLGLKNATVPVQATFRGAWQRGVLALDDFQLSMASVRANAHGRLGLGAAAGQVTDGFEGALTAPRIDQLPLAALGLPAASGSLVAHGSLHGALNRPTGSLTIEGRRLGGADWRLGSLTLVATVDAKQQAQATLNAAALRDHQGEQIQRLSLSMSGTVPGGATPGRQRLTAQIRAALGTLSLAATGQWQSSQWQGQLTSLALTKLRVHGQSLPDWRLERAVPIALAANAQRLGSLCLASADAARLCVQGNFSPDQGGRGQAAVTANLPLRLAQPWLPPGVALPGRFTLSGQANLRGGVPDATVEVSLPASSVRWPSVLGNTPIDYAPVNGRLRWQNAVLSANAETDTTDLLSVQGHGQWTMTGAEPIAGSLAVGLPRLDRWGFGLPMLSGLSGRATAQMSLAGTRLAPRLSGQATLADLAFSLPDTGVSYRAGAMSAHINTDGALAFSGTIAAVAPPPPTAPTAPGDATVVDSASLHWSGTGQLADLPHWQVQATLDGEGVPVLRLPSLSVDASPALSVKANAEGATVDGRVVLPRLVAQVAALPAGVVAPTEDLVIVGQAPPPKKSAVYPVQGQVTVKLGDAVHLSGMGFTSSLAGGLNLRLRPNQPVAAQGELRLVDGRYRAYGQELQINPGRLVFVGPLTDPGLAVRAERTVDSTTVGLNIAGTLMHPKTTVFSNPSVSESDALSLLITGRSLNDASMSDGSMIKDAAVGLGIAQGDSVLRDLGQRFGFSGLGLDTTGGLDGTRLSLGKQLNDRLFVRYAIGVFNGVGELITRYRLSRLFSIELTTSPEASGGDLIYQIK